MKTDNTLQKFSIQAGLLILAAGFALLGILSFTVREGTGANILTGDRAFSIIVSTIDLLIAATFLFFALLYWKTTPTRSPNH